MEELKELLSKLTNELKNSKKSVFGSGKVVDEYVVTDIISKIGEVLPVEIKEAQYILKDKDRILDEAKAEYNRIIADAEAKAGKILDEDNLIKQARLEADDIMDNAEDYAAMLDRETKKRIDKMFEDSEEQLVEILKVVRSCREELMGSMIKKED